MTDKTNRYRREDKRQAYEAVLDCLQWHAGGLILFSRGLSARLLHDITWMLMANGLSRRDARDVAAKALGVARGRVRIG